MVYQIHLLIPNVLRDMSFSVHGILRWPRCGIDCNPLTFSALNFLPPCIHPQFQPGHSSQGCLVFLFRFVYVSYLSNAAVLAVLRFDRKKNINDLNI